MGGWKYHLTTGHSCCCAHRDGLFSPSYPGGLLWLGINYLQVDRRGNYSVWTYSRVLLPSPNSWGQQEEQQTWDCSEWWAFLCHGRAWYPLFTREQGCISFNAGVGETGHLGELNTAWEWDVQAMKWERKTEFGEAGWVPRKVWQGTKLGKAGGSIRSWEAGDGGETHQKMGNRGQQDVGREERWGTNIVLFRIKPLEYLCVIPSSFQWCPWKPYPVALQPRQCLLEGVTF